jgi:hypothetical protein
MKESNPAQAIRHYKAALKVTPDDPKLLYSLKKAENARGGGDAATH